MGWRDFFPFKFNSSIWIGILSIALRLVSTEAEIYRFAVVYSGEMNASVQERVENIVTQTLEIDVREPKVQVIWRQASSRGIPDKFKTVCTLIDDGVHGIVSSLSYRRQFHLQHLIDDSCIPHVTISNQIPETETRHKFTIEMTPSLKTKNQLIRDMIRHFGWKSLGIIYDGSIETRQVIDLVFILSKDLIQVMLVNFELVSKMESHMLFLGSSQNFHRLLYNEAKLFNTNTLWLVFNEDISVDEITQIFLELPKTGIVFLKRKWQEHWPCEDCSVYRGDGPCVKLTLQERLLVNSVLLLYDIATENNLISKWRASSNGGICNPAKNSHKHCQNITMVGSKLRDSSPAVYEIHSKTNFWRKSQRKRWETKSGEWNVLTGLRLQDNSSLQSLWNHFGKDGVLVAAVEDMPFVIKTTTGGVTKYTGFSVDVLNELSSRMGFNYTIVEPVDAFYGGQDDNGVWNGMVGMVQRGEVEMAIGPITITLLRDQVIDFTKPITEGSSGIMMRSLGYGGGTSIFQTLKPFSVEVWLSIGTAIAFMAIVSYIVNSSTPYQTGHGRYGEGTEMTSLKGNCWIMYASITEQGVEVHPRSTSGRCVLGFWWVFTILLVASYTANLTAVLTVVIPPSPINSLYDLLEQDTIQPIVPAGTSFETLFQNSDLEVYKRTWERLKHSPKLPFESDIRKLVRTGAYAVINDKPLLDYRASLECEAFTVAEQSFDVVGYGIVIPEGALYRDTMDRLIVKLQEAGLVDKWRNYWWSANNTCRDKSQSLPTSLGLNSLGGLFLLYLGTVAVACLSYIGEVIYKKFRTK